MGDCPDLKDEFSFFNNTLALRQAHDIGDKLKAASIIPDNSKTYTADQIIKALTPIDGFKPMLGCIEKGNVQYLHEISFCIDKSLKDIDCDESVRSLTHDEVSDCDLSKPMVLVAPGPLPSPDM